MALEKAVAYFTFILHFIFIDDVNIIWYYSVSPKNRSNRPRPAI